MKKLNLLIILLSLMILASCDFKFNHKKTIVVKDDSPYMEKTELKGNYGIGSFRFKKNTNSTELDKDALNFGKIPFQFFENNTLKIFPKLGLEYFGDSIFKYEVTKENVIFTTSNNKIIKMSYQNDNGIIRLNIKHKYIERFDLVKL